MADEKKSVIIIGAGVGGVATAARLARAGFKVTVIEKNDHVGGRCSLLHHNGHRFDQGPSLLLLPGLFEEAFHDLGTSMTAEGVKLHKCEPNYHIHFHDGASFTLSTDLASMKREIEAWEGKPGFDRYLSFLKESHTHYEASVIHVLHKTFETYFSMLRPGFLKHIISLHPFESIWNRASKYFLTERLRRVFTFGSMYMGMSPYEAPGTYSLLQYTELAEGIWYPEGGFNKIPRTIADISTRYGVDYRLRTSVASITTNASNDTATGVLLADGTTLEADTVICNADLVYAYNNLLPPSSYAKSLSARPASCSSISFYWALDRQVPELKAHNIFLAEHYQESFDQIFHDQTLPNEPSFYVNVPSRVDPTAAPAGKDTVVVLCPVGHLLAPETSTPASWFTSGKPRGLNPQSPAEWDALISRARTSVLRTIESRLGVPIQKHITHEQLNTPSTWETKFNLDKGAILGLSHSFFNVLCFRPAIKHPKLKGLRFVGASTHPGTGVPIVLAGARLVADSVCEEYGVKKPWGEWDVGRYEEYGRAWTGGKGEVGVDGAVGAEGGLASKVGDAQMVGRGREMNGSANGSANGSPKGVVKTISPLDEVQSPGVSWVHVLLAFVAWMVAIWVKRNGYV